MGESQAGRRAFTPEENGRVERAQRTLGEALDAAAPQGLAAARAVFQRILRWDNEGPLHSALPFLRAVDYDRGEPEKLPAARGRKTAEARHRRRQRHRDVTQPTLPFEAADSEAKHWLLSEPMGAG